jgi:hypothetical protein
VTSYVVLFVYGAGYLASVVPLARMILDGDAPSGPPDEDERWMSFFLGALVALFWPLLWAGKLLYMALRGTALRSSWEIEQERAALDAQERQELERLRALAREYKIKGGELL